MTDISSLPIIVQIYKYIELIWNGISKALEFITSMWNTIVTLINEILYAGVPDPVAADGISLLLLMISVCLSLVAFKIIAKILG